MSSNIDTEQSMSNLPDRFRPLMAGKLQATIQFRLTDPGGGDWILAINDGQCSTFPGIDDSPDAIVTMAAADFVGINTGTVHAPDIFWSGRIDIQGDVEVVISLAPIFGWQ